MKIIRNKFVLSRPFEVQIIEAEGKSCGFEKNRNIENIYRP